MKRTLTALLAVALLLTSVGCAAGFLEAPIRSTREAWAGAIKPPASIVKFALTLLANAQLEGTACEATGVTKDGDEVTVRYSSAAVDHMVASKASLSIEQACLLLKKGGRYTISHVEKDEDDVPTKVTTGSIIVGLGTPTPGPLVATKIKAQ